MRTIPTSFAALALTAGIASAKPVHLNLSGVITESMVSSSSTFAGLSVGDAWSFTMTYSIDDNWSPPSFTWTPQFGNPVTFVSATFTAGGQTISVSEGDLNTVNWMSSPLTEDAPRPETNFDMVIFTGGSQWFNGLGIGTPVTTDIWSLLALERTLASGTLGSTTNPDWFTTFSLDAGTLQGSITDSAFSGGRVIPAPASLALLASFGLAASRRRR